MELTKEQIAFTRGFIRKVAADDGVGLTGKGYEAAPDLAGEGLDLESILGSVKDWTGENQDALAGAGIGAAAGQVLPRIIAALLGRGQPGALSSAATTLAGGGAGAAAGHYNEDIARFLGDLFGSGGSTA